MGNLSNLNFNADDVPERRYDVIPADWYDAIIEDSDVKTTKSGDGRYINLKFQIVDGPYAGRTIYNALNIEHHNENVVKYAYIDLGSICRCVGILNPKDTSELHNKKLRIKITVQPPKAGYEASNDIKGYKPTEQAAPAPAGVAKPSWKR